MADTNHARIRPLLADIYDFVVVQHRLSGFRYGELNASGSLLLLPIDGRARLDLNNQLFELARGNAAWITESEWVRIQVVAAPWSYLQVRFTVPGLPAPPARQRVCRLGPTLIPLVTDLRRAWESTGSGASRALRVHGLVSTILGRILETSRLEPAESTGGVNPWWQVETEVRSNLARHYSLAELAGIAGTNRILLERSAKAATGLTPIRRLRQIRLSHAQTLMRDTRLLIKEVAAAVGYHRIHEFSRDYRKAFGVSPRRHRADGFESRPTVDRKPH